MAAVEPVIQLAHKYRSEFEHNFDGIRQRSAQLGTEAQQHLQQIQERAQQLQPLAKQKTEELQNVVAEMGPVEGLQPQRILETFMWTALIGFAYSLANGITALALAPLLSSVLDTSAVVVLAYGALPYIAYKHVNNGGEDAYVRIKLLGFAVVIGCLNGTLMTDRFLSTMGPLQFLTPLMIGIVTQLAAGSYGNSRQTFLGMTIGSGLACHLVFGLIGGQLSVGYILLACAYSACGLITLQLYLKHHLANQDAPVHMYQFGYFCGAVGCHAIIYLLLGSPAESHKQ